jgi:hypothetical protein
MGISVRIAVSDPLPVFRRGILATLGGAGFEPETVSVASQRVV